MRSSAPRRRRALTYLRAAISAVLFVYVLSHVDVERLHQELPNLGPSTIAWLFGAFALTALALVMSARRWQKVLEALDLRVPFRRSLGVCAAGQFLSSVLPSTIGGDVLRVRRMGRTMGDSPTVFASIAIERLTGWLVLPAFTLAALVVRPGLLGRLTWLAVGICVACLGLLLVVLYLAEHPRVGGRIVGETYVRRFLGAVHLGLGRLRRQPRSAWRLIGLAAGLQLVAVAAVAMAGRAMGISIGPMGWLAIVPLVFIVQVLPLSVGGFGVREGALALFTAPLGVGAGRAIVLGLLIYTLNLTISLTGLPTFAWDARYGELPARAT